MGEMFASAYSFMSNIDKEGVYGAEMAFFLFQSNGTEQLSPNASDAIDFFRSVTPVPFRVWIVNRSFIAPIGYVKTRERYPHVIYVRYFTPPLLHTEWLLCMDGDVMVERPFLDAMFANLEPNNALIYGAVDRVYNKVIPWSEDYMDVRLRHFPISRWNWNFSRFLNSGFLLMRNGPELLEGLRIMRMGLLRDDPGFEGDQESVHHFFPRNREGVMPWSFNCQPYRRLWNCSGSHIKHGHRTAARRGWGRRLLRDIRAWIAMGRPRMPIVPGQWRWGDPWEPTGLAARTPGPRPPIETVLPDVTPLPHSTFKPRRTRVRSRSAQAMASRAGSGRALKA